MTTLSSRHCFGERYGAVTPASEILVPKVDTRGVTKRSAGLCRREVVR